MVPDDCRQISEKRAAKGVAHLGSRKMVEGAKRRISKSLQMVGLNCAAVRFNGDVSTEIILNF